MSRIIRQIAIILACVAAFIATARPVPADPFLEAATNPALMRDFHVVSAGGYQVGSASTDNGQATGISYSQIIAGSDIWNNERNQVMAGLQYGRRKLDRELALPDGFAVPERLDNISAGFLFKHITSGDWSITQGVRYTWAWTDMPSITVRNTVDLVGLAAISRQPGVMWAFGYIYDQRDYLHPAFRPIVVYVNTTRDKWAFTAGYPFLSFSYAPHPDWMVGGGALISYKLSAQNMVSLSISGDNWAYRLAGPGVKTVAYTAQTAGFTWRYIVIDHRTAVFLNASLGRQFNRKLGTNDKQTIGDATIMGFNVGFFF